MLQDIEREKEDYFQTLSKLKAERADKIDLIREFQERQVKEIRQISDEAQREIDEKKQATTALKSRVQAYEL